MSANVTLLLIFVTLASVTAQTFQYSRGWTNGKRDGRGRQDPRDVVKDLSKFLSPCQKNKLKYLIEGRPITERMMVPCDLLDTEEYPREYTARKLDELMEYAFQ